MAPLLAVCARIWKEWIPWLHQISVLYGAQVSSICLPSKDGLLTQHSRCNVGWVQKCKYTHIERTLSPEHTYWLAHTADADRQRHTWKRTHLFYTHQLWCPALCCCNDPNYSTTTSSYNWGNGLFLMGYFHITPVFQSWVVDPPPCLWTFQFCSVFDIFWWFLVSLAICLVTSSLYLFALTFFWIISMDYQ